MYNLYRPVLAEPQREVDRAHCHSSAHQVTTAITAAADIGGAVRSPASASGEAEPVGACSILVARR